MNTNQELRRARLKIAKEKANHSSSAWEKLKTEFGRCVRCGKSGPLEKDHIIPICHGGSNGTRNLQPLCTKCNRSKGPDDFNWKRFRRIMGFSVHPPIIWQYSYDHHVNLGR